MSVDSKSPGRNRGIVLRCSHPTYLSIVADPFPRPLPVGRISISSPSYERDWEKTWDSYSKHGRSCRLSLIDTNERDFLHTLVRKRPLGLSRFETMPHNVRVQPPPKAVGCDALLCDIGFASTLHHCKILASKPTFRKSPRDSSFKNYFGTRPLTALARAL